MIPGSGYQLSDFAYQGAGEFVYQGLVIGDQVVVLAFRNTVWDNPYTAQLDTDGQENESS